MVSKNMTLLLPCLQIYKNFFEEWKKKKKKTGHDSIQKNANAGSTSKPSKAVNPEDLKKMLPL